MGNLFGEIKKNGAGGRSSFGEPGAGPPIDELVFVLAAHDESPVQTRARPSADPGQARRHRVKVSLNSNPLPS
jgi:hypothetical protein